MSVSNNQSTRETLETRVKTSRGNLLLVVAFTVINIVLLVIESDSYFLFSAYVPYVIVATGMMFCGMYPSEYFTPEELADITVLDQSSFPIFIVVAAVILLLYLCSWFFSKNNKMGWLIFALIIFSIDTLLLLSGFSADSIVDIIFHGWVIVSLVLGINACSKLKKMPVEELTAEMEKVNVDGEVVENAANSEIIRVADLGVKSRVLLEAEALGYAITYRRVKRTNELVVNGNVYDEVEMLIETDHTLRANVDGHLFEAEYDGRFSYLRVDGEMIAKKIRLL